MQNSNTQAVVKDLRRVAQHLIEDELARAFTRLNPHVFDFCNLCCFKSALMCVDALRRPGKLWTCRKYHQLAAHVHLRKLTWRLQRGFSRCKVRLGSVKEALKWVGCFLTAAEPFLLPWL